METMTNGVSMIDLIDQIEAEESFAEMQVCNALLDSYSKSICILENCSEDADLTVFGIFQENAFTDAVKEAKGDQSENIIKKIFLFIPRLIAAFIRNLRSNRKGLEKAVDDVESIAEDLADVAKNPEAHVESGASTTPPAEKTTDDAPTPKKPEPEVTERRGVPGASYGDDDKAKRQAARSTRKLNRSAKQGSMFLLPERSTTNSMWSDFTFYVDKDIRVELSADMIDYVRGLNTRTVDYQALIDPVQEAMILIGRVFTNYKYKSDVTRDIHRSEVVLSSDNGSLTKIINAIKKQLGEADTQLKSIKDYAKNTKFTGQKRNFMMSEIIKLYRVALDWMKYIEASLQKISKDANKISEAFKNFSTNKKSSVKVTNDKHPLGAIGATATLNVNDKRTLVECANRIQRIVSDSQKAYQDIIAASYHGLDMLRSELFKLAKSNGIKINASNVPARSEALFRIDSENKGYVNTASGGYGTKAKQVSGWF